MGFTDDQSLVREKGMREKRWGISWVRERERKKRWESKRRETTETNNV